MNGELLIDNWDNGGGEGVSQLISLEAGQKYDIKLEYFEETGEASAQLLWESLSQNKEIIPASQLYPAKPLASWSGEVTPQFDEDYTFNTFSDLPVRLMVNGEVVLDSFTNPDEIALPCL